MKNIAFFIIFILQFFVLSSFSNGDDKHKLVNAEKRVYVEQINKNHVRVIVYQKELYDSLKSQNNFDIEQKYLGCDNFISCKIIRDVPNVFDAVIKTDNFKKIISIYFSVSESEVPNL